MSKASAKPIGTTSVDFFGRRNGTNIAAVRFVPRLLSSISHPAGVWTADHGDSLQREGRRAQYLSGL